MTLAGFTVVAAALLASVFTWLLAYAGYRLRLARELDARLAALQREFEERVRRGVLAAGEELLPQLREQVRLGFQDALKKSEAAGLMENAAGVVNLGTDIVAGSLGALFGKSRK